MTDDVADPGSSAPRDDDPVPAAGRRGIALGRLEQALGYNLRMAQELAFRAYLVRVGDPTLKPKRYAVLQLIAENPWLSQTELGAAVGRDKSSITSALQDLIKHGLVRRRALSSDRRIRLLALTDKGQRVLAELRKQAEAHDRMLSAAISAEERQTLIRLLGKLTTASAAYVQAVEGEDPPDSEG